jgi:hypothetical protein
MASSSEDDEEGGLTRPELPDLGADELCQSMRALASSTAGPSSSVKVRAAAVGATLDAHADVSEAIEPHLGQLESEMEQLNAILEHKFARTRDATMELLDEFGVESDYKFQTAASEKKKFDNSVVATEEVQAANDAALTELETQRCAKLEAELFEEE